MCVCVLWHWPTNIHSMEIRHRGILKGISRYVKIITPSSDGVPLQMNFSESNHYYKREIGQWFQRWFSKRVTLLGFSVPFTIAQIILPWRKRNLVSHDRTSLYTTLDMKDTFNPTRCPFDAIPFLIQWSLITWLETLTTLLRKGPINPLGNFWKLDYVSLFSFKLN